MNDYTIPNQVADYLQSHNIPTLRNQEGLSDVGSGMYGGQEGFYLKSAFYEYDFDETKVKELFPLEVGPYRVLFMVATPMEYEDDRIWPASLGFIVDNKRD
jgi:hypothetical protein